MKRRLTRTERFLAALLVDVIGIAAFACLGLADKIAPTTACAAITGIVLSRKQPVDVDEDDDDQDGTPRARSGLSKGVAAASGVLTMFVPLFWVWDRLRARGVA